MGVGLMTTNIHRIDYSNDGFENLSSKLLFSGFGGAGLSSKIHGYHVGGNPDSKTYIQRINYFNDTVSQVHPISTPAISNPATWWEYLMMIMVGMWRRIRLLYKEWSFRMM